MNSYYKMDILKLHDKFKENRITLYISVNDYKTKPIHLGRLLEQKYTIRIE